LIGAFEKAYPQYYDLKYKIQTASVSDLQKSLNDATALVEYFLGDSAIYIFAITRDGFDVVETGKDSAFSAAIASLANSFKNVTSKAAYLRHAAELYQLLVKPVEQRIADKFRWVIIPDGELHQIPFEALLPETVSINDEVDYKKLNYLIKQHEISYHYSASLLLKNWQEQKPANFANLFVGFAPVFSKWANNGNILFADPTNLLSFTVAIQDKTKYLKTRDGKTLDELPQSEHEVRAILAMFPKKSRAYLHDEASEENFKRKISGYKYVHVATHGVIIEESPKLSHLAFSQPQNAGAAEDGYLHAAETYNLDLGADLLVLSSCESGTGKLAKGEGLLALTRGFLYSGARNIIASLWKVYDQHTSQLMVEIYRQIAAGKSYSAALREAKLKMIANPETAGPQSWASFVLIGK
jgi:CHAT domain-containing protein